MASYRVYVFENRDAFERHDLKLANDGEACFAAWALLKPGKQVQIWEGSRRVAELSASAKVGSYQVASTRTHTDPVSF